MIQISYSEDSKILIRSFKGRVSFADVMESWKELVGSDRIGPQVIGILNDFTYAELLMDREELPQLMDFFQEHSEIFQRVKLAVVMLRPENIVLPVIASRNYPQFRIEAFSSLETAEDWIRAG